MGLGVKSHKWFKTPGGMWKCAGCGTYAEQGVSVLCPAAPPEYHKVLVALIRHFIVSEGTDYLGDKGEPADVSLGDTPLDAADLKALTAARDEARKLEGWHGY